MRDREGYALGFGQPGGSRATEMAKRPKLVKIDDEMRRWCAALEEELSSWPDVQTKPMFGMAACYRGRASSPPYPERVPPKPIARSSSSCRAHAVRGFAPRAHQARAGLSARSNPTASWETC